MIRHLHIQNIALIENLELHLGPGLTVITGETGAGKSILINSLHLILGGRSQTQLIRSGSDEGSVTAVINLPDGHALNDQLADLEIPLDQGELLIRRTISRNGRRNRIYLNDRLVTLSTLRRITEAIVDISSQHEHLSLKDSSTHLPCLDSFATLDDHLQPYIDHYQQWADSKRRYLELEKINSDRIERESFLRFQLAELDEAGLKKGEEDELEVVRNQLRNASLVRENSHAVYHQLYNCSNSAVERIDKALAALTTLANVDKSLQPSQERLSEARHIVEDLAFVFSHYASDLEAGERNLDQIEERLALLQRLKRRFAPTLDGMIERRESIRQDLQRLESLDDELARLQTEEARSYQEVKDAAVLLTQARKIAATRFETDVREILERLEMPQTRLKISITPCKPTPRGMDDVQILISTNVGEGFEAIGKIASGGELSRIMLAFKKVLSVADPVLTHVFDEVDSGIGGTTADTVGELLKETARTNQVICITHLPQIARFGDQHLVVAKQTDDGRTTSAVRALDADQRTRELVRMLGGDQSSHQTRQFAQSLLELANSPR